MLGEQQCVELRIGVVVSMKGDRRSKQDKVAVVKSRDGRELEWEYKGKFHQKTSDKKCSLHLMTSIPSRVTNVWVNSVLEQYLTDVGMTTKSSPTSRNIYRSFTK